TAHQRKVLYRERYPPHLSRFLFRRRRYAKKIRQRSRNRPSRLCLSQRRGHLADRIPRTCQGIEAGRSGIQALRPPRRQYCRERRPHISMRPDIAEIDAVPAIVMHSGPPRRLSRIFADLAREAEGVVTVEQIRQALGDRSFATLLVFLACLNLLPFPPGSTLLLGIPLMLISLQMVRRDSTVWLPRFILRKSVGAKQFRLLTDRLVPRLEWIE